MYYWINYGLDLLKQFQKKCPTRSGLRNAPYASASNIFAASASLVARLSSFPIASKPSLNVFDSFANKSFEYGDCVLISVLFVVGSKEGRSGSSVFFVRSSCSIPSLIWALCFLLSEQNEAISASGFSFAMRSSQRLIAISCNQLAGW